MHDSTLLAKQDTNLPSGWTDELSCVIYNELSEKACTENAVSPLVLANNGTYKGLFYEQHFLLTSINDCNQPNLITIQISKRTILNWIREKAGDKFLHCNTRQDLERIQFPHHIVMLYEKNKIIGH